MHPIVVALTFVILIAVAYRATLVYFRAHAARKMMVDWHGYENVSGNYEKTLLVLGDSTAVGVGASTPEETVAGRLATYIGATHTENYAVSGAAVNDLKPQIDQARLRRYDDILIQIGGNDIILFHDAKRTAKRLDVLMMTLPDADTIILMSAGNVGGATLFPYIVRPFHTLINKAIHRWFEKVALRRHALYVNLYEPKKTDPFFKEPERYLSADGLHPSSDGYGLWFDRVKAALENDDAVATARKT